MIRDASASDGRRGRLENQIPGEQRHFHAEFENVVGVALLRVVVAPEEVRVKALVGQDARRFGYSSYPRLAGRRGGWSRVFGVRGAGSVLRQIEIDETEFFPSATAFRFPTERYSASEGRRLGNYD